MPKYIEAVLGAARAISGAENDKQLSEILGVTPAAVSAWRRGVNTPGDVQIQRLASLIGTDFPTCQAFCKVDLEDNVELKSMYVRIVEQEQALAKLRVHTGNQSELFSE